MAGYLGRQPVGIGNDAHTHTQNDVYGQVLAAPLPLYVGAHFRDPRLATPPALVEELWRRPSAC